ncbi:LPS-assembly protein LptD [Roseateles sp. DAIF2]|uniref:LPS-assembly protein LptD n=1 Tax=Roseateles sp. DAIF2 TaxID=2714952 RepID=UPI0018A28FEE|nr:LPS assembly protein LptD [Roseateles sp. DAIF2]QPF76246.1 LPS-assembly protein LptD [Roseateles sp. DAIF2]
MLRPSPPPSRFPLHPLLLALGLGAAGLAQAADPLPPAATGAAEPLRLRPSRLLTPPGTPGQESKPALVLSAKKLDSQLDQRTQAEGEAELRYGDLLLRAETLSYDHASDLAQAGGGVEVSRGGNVVRGPSLQLYLERFEGEFVTPSYFFSQTGGGGQAQSLRFLDAKRIRAEAATYSSCPAVEPGETPAWQLTAQTLKMDFEANEGLATGAVLRFHGVPILAAPALSFPLSSERKSGWLPPNVGLDNRSGFELGLPYYWNIAPQRDATLTPFLMSRRGVGLDSEFRYLESEHQGQLNLAWLPWDRVADRKRWALNLANSGELGRDWKYRLNAERVSDDDYWKDLPKRISSPTQRLLGTDLQLNRTRSFAWGEATAYARVQQWQVLQGTDPLTRFASPYQRSPQIGLRMASAADEGVLAGFIPWGRRARLEGSLELEYNRFDLPTDLLAAQRADGSIRGGSRVHALGHVSLPMGGSAWWLIPKVSVNAASYSFDRIEQGLPSGMVNRHASRTIPSFSIDHGWIFERETRLFGRNLLQTLEPRLLYVNTAYRDQSALPNFDAAAKDFNFDSIYTENQFSGVDRVSDAHQLTVGATTRWLESERGEELLRLGLVQRFLFSDQRITPDGQVLTQKVSDLLLLGSAHLSRRWWLDGNLQFNPDAGRSVRSTLRARYSPGPFRTLSAAYRLARGQSEQLELGWQWPLFGAAAAREQLRSVNANSSGSGCSGGGAWYSAGRLQYSLRDRRFTDSVVGMEYDAGCWILRVGAERLSTGRAETNTRLLLQLELVGLSRIGSNALGVLRDNIPGYRQLSEPRSSNRSYD